MSAVPEVDSAEAAGRLVQNLPELWKAAKLQERHDLIISMIDAVYFDLSSFKSIVAIKPKPPFRPIFEVATAREGSGVILLQNEKLPAGGPGVDADLCSGWRRGRVELAGEHEYEIFNWAINAIIRCSISPSSSQLIDSVRRSINYETIGKSQQ